MVRTLLSCGWGCRCRPLWHPPNGRSYNEVQQRGCEQKNEELFGTEISWTFVDATTCDPWPADDFITCWRKKTKSQDFHGKMWDAVWCGIQLHAWESSKMEKLENGVPISWLKLESPQPFRMRYKNGTQQDIHIVLYFRTYYHIFKNTLCLLNPILPNRCACVYFYWFILFLVVFQRYTETSGLCVHGARSCWAAATARTNAGWGPKHICFCCRTDRWMTTMLLVLKTRLVWWCFFWRGDGGRGGGGQ